MLKPGLRLNHYEILRLLGKGGMGEVYVATDLKLGRKVALKVLPAEIASEGERHERFEREARAVAALQHPNIVTLHSIEEAEGMTFLVMELIEGKQLSEVVPSGGLSLDRFLEIAIPLADAVAGAHARGVTHRDLKPANILIDDGGRPQVLDFGLAKVADNVELGAESLQPTEALTGEGKIVGTIAYMSPEQVEGKAVDPRSDIFSLGVIFYEMATGRRPFDGDTSMSVLTAILRDEPKPVTEHKERLPRYLGRVVKRCLQKDASRRYQSALDLRNDLLELEEELASGELTAPHGAAVASQTGRSWLPIIVGLAILGAAGLWWVSTRGAGAPIGSGRPAFEIRRLTARGSPRNSAISPDGRYVAYTSEEIGFRRLRLQQVASGSDIELIPAVDWDVYISGLAFSPDGQYVRYTERPGGDSATVWEIPVLGGSPRKLLEEVAIGPTYSPDGTSLAFVPSLTRAGRWRRLDVVSLVDGARRTVFELPEADAETDIEDVDWSPDGESLAFSVADDRGDHLSLVTLVSGEVSRVPGRGFFSIRDLCWSPSGEQLVVVGAALQGRSQPWLVDPDSGARRQLVSDFNNYDGCSSTTDGRLMTMVREEEHSQIWLVDLEDPRSARSVSTTTGRSDGSDSVAWLDSGALVHVAPDGASWNLWRVPAEGGTSVRLTSAGATNVAVNRLGQVVFGSGWDVEERQGVYALEGEGQRRLSPDGLFADRPSTSPDGRWVFYELLTGDRMKFVRSPFDGGEPEVVTEELAHLATFSPDGSRMALHVLNPEVDRWQTAVLPVEGKPESYLDFHSETYSPWADDNALFVSRTVDGIANIYRLDLADLSEEQVTFFADGEIFTFEVSPDLGHLAVGRGEILNDLLLVEGLLGSPADDGR